MGLLEGDFLGFLSFILGLLGSFLWLLGGYSRAPRIFVLGLLGVNLGFLDFNSVAS